MITCEDIDRIEAMHALLARREREEHQAACAAARPGVAARRPVLREALCARLRRKPPSTARAHTAALA